jgi:DNA polymerase III alpha subunit
LGIVPDFDIGRDPASVFTGDLPDIDIDYIPVVREYLKNRWAIETFGSQHVCNIGSYTTFGIKSALIDMARVHEAPRDEVMQITKNLEDKDEEGKPLTWDSALRMHEELKAYVVKYPDVAEAAKKILNRNRAMGVHAGGLIIASIPLHDMVPLVKRKDNPQASAWTEGLNGQELGPVGLVKFDLLVISNLLQIARCCEMVKKRHGLKGVCNRPDGPDWSDVEAWRDDPKAIEMANHGDLKCIFQFDSEGMRALVKSGGVDGFEDLVAYSALFRPGCLASGMTKLYVDRKRGRDKYDIHPLMKPYLQNTYGIMVYQEQIMQILHAVGEIPLKDCEAVRKAISKKKIEQFIKYKEQFVLNGQRRLGCDAVELEKLWGQIESWAGYGFNRCLTKTNQLYDYVRQGYVSIGDLFIEFQSEIKPLVSLDSFVDRNIAKDQLVDVFETGEKEVFEIELDNGIKLQSTLDHKFMCSDGDYHTVQKILYQDLEIICEDFSAKSLVKTCRIKSIKPLGKQQTYNLTMSSSQHNYAVFGTEPGKFVISRNSHAVAYTYISAWLLYLKSHYPEEFYTAILSCETLSDKIKDVKMEAKIHGVEMHRLDINKSSINFELIGNMIYFGFSNVKGVGEEPARRIVAGQPYRSFEEFLVRFGTDASVLKPIIALRCFRDRDPVTLWKFTEHFKDKLKKLDDKRKRLAASLERYEEELVALIPGVTFKLSDLSGANPFDNDEYRLRYDKDEVLQVEKTVPCDPAEPGSFPVTETESFEVDGADAIVEREVQKHYKKIRVDRKFNKWKNLKKLWQKRISTLQSFEQMAMQQAPKLVDFNPDDRTISAEILRELRDPVACEVKYYGFTWIHELERSPDYHGDLTFASLKSQIDPTVSPVEIQVKKCSEMKSKKGNTYRLVMAEDATGSEQRINVWPDDYERFKSEFEVGNLLRLRLQPPSGGFNTFLLESNQQGKWRGTQRYKHKEDDPRVIPMRPGVREDEKFMTDEEVLRQFDNGMGENG